MHERDVWALSLAALATVLFAFTGMGPLAWFTTLAVLSAAWSLDFRLDRDGEIAVVGPLALGLGLLLVLETPPQQMFLNGVVRSGVLAIGAVGLTLVYGILNLVNFAHGDFLTTGGYLVWLAATPAFGLAPWNVALALLVPLIAFLAWDVIAPRHPSGGAGPWLYGSLALALVSWLALPHGKLIALAVFAWGLAAWNRLGSTPMQTPDRWTMAAACLCIGAAAGLSYAFDALWTQMVGSLVVASASVAALSVLLDRTLWTRMRDREANLLTLMIVSIGVAFALRSLLQLAFGGGNIVFMREAGRQSLAANYWLGLLGLDVRVTTMDVWIVVTSAVAILVTTLVMQRTRVGKAMRALADNTDLARVAGIDAERVVIYVWVLGGFLAGLAGALLAMETVLHPNLGWRALLPLFAVVILGGVGSVPGALLGGVVIGMAEELSVHWLATIGLDTSYNVAVGFLILIVTLIIRPEGIMGVRRT